MSSRPGLSQWLEHHPEAADFCKSWLRAKAPEDSFGQLAKRLAQDYGCPYTNAASMGRALKTIYPDDFPKIDKSVVRSWFAKNRGAEKVVRGWLASRKPNSSKLPNGLKLLLTTLREEYGYPYTTYDALRDFATERWPGLANPTPGVGRAHNDFSRTDADLREIGKAKTFIFGCAVNNMGANGAFVSAVERLAEETQGRILSCPIMYINPRRAGESAGDAKARVDRWGRQEPEEWWDERLRPYMINSEIRPHPLLSLMARKVQATANNPLPAKIDGRTKGRSAVTGHPQVSMRTVSTPGAKLPKQLWSSGAFTRPDGYSDTDAGDMAEFHHSEAAVIAQVQGDEFYLRNITWDGESFIDLDRRYYADRTEPAPRPEALVTGDTHAPYGLDPVVRAATYGAGGLIERYQPKRVMWHDLADSEFCNPHEWADRLTHAIAAMDGRGSGHQEFMDLAGFVDSVPGGPEYYVVPSNHDMFLDRWLNAGERNVTPENEELYYTLNAQARRHYRKNGNLPTFLEMALRPRMKSGRTDITFLPLENEFSVLGVLLGQHGHKGPGGARGGLKNMSKIGTRGIFGHIHGPGIWQGAYFVGTNSILRPRYIHGSPSNWLHTDALLHANGYRQLLTLINGRHRGV